MARVCILALVVALLQPARTGAQGPAAEVYPIVFVHGFCSNADTWSVMTAALGAFNPARYGTTVTRLSAGVALPGQDASQRMFAIDFRGSSGSFDPFDVAQVSIAAKAAELKQVIDEIKRFTGHSKVIVVGHSLGGLVGRWYIQRGAGASAYEGDVAALATIDAPNLGSSLVAFDDRAVEIDTFAQCWLLPSTNKAELAPGSGTLATLNASPLRGDTPVASIASSQAEFPNPRTDVVASYESQNLLSVYPQLAGTVVFLLDNTVSLGSARQILHLFVNQLPSTIGLVQLIVSAVDRLQQSTPPPPTSAPGAPQLVLIPAGGVATLRWTPAAAGGVPSAYVLRGTYRNPQGVAIPFDLPVDAATSIVVPSNLPGAFTVRVHAQNAAGESPASNELAFTMPPE